MSTTTNSAPKPRNRVKSNTKVKAQVIPLENVNEVLLNNPPAKRGRKKGSLGQSSFVGVSLAELNRLFKEDAVISVSRKFVTAVQLQTTTISPATSATVENGGGQETPLTPTITNFETETSDDGPVAPKIESNEDSAKRNGIVSIDEI